MALLVNGEAVAKKPAPEPSDPSYGIADIDLVPTSGVRALNEWGGLAGEWAYPPGEAFLLVPEDTDEDGYADRWSRDTDPEDGVNDLVQGLGVLGLEAEGERSIAQGVNNLGFVTGYSGDDGGWSGHAFLWDGDTMHDLGTQYHTSMISFGKDVNDDGVVMGVLYRGNTTPTTAPDKRHFVIVPQVIGGVPTWFRDEDGDGLNDLMQLLGLGFRGVDINEQGWIAGRWHTDPSGYNGYAAVLIPRDTDDDGAPDTWFVDEDGDEVNDLVTLLPAPEDAHYVHAVAINENGWMVGGWTSAQYAKLAALWRPNADGTYTFVDLGGVKSYADAAATDINDAGVVVGYGQNTKRAYRLPSGLWVYEYPSTPVMWVDGEQQPIEEMVDTGGMALSAARAINDRGEILAGSEAGLVMLVPIR